MELKPYKKKSIWTVIVTVAIVVSFVSLLGIFNKISIDKSNKLLVDEVNKICPKVIDSISRLDSATALSGNKIQPNYSFLNVDKVGIDTTMSKNNMKETLVNHVKTSSTYKIFRDHETTVLFTYYDKQGNHLFDIKFLRTYTNNECSFYRDNATCTKGLAKNWLTRRIINFCFAIYLLCQAGLYKFGNSSLITVFSLCNAKGFLWIKKDEPTNLNSLIIQILNL